MGSAIQFLRRELAPAVLLLSLLACAERPPIQARFSLSSPFSLQSPIGVAPANAPAPASGGAAPVIQLNYPQTPPPGFSVGVITLNRFSLQRVAGDSLGGDALGLNALSASFKQIAGSASDPGGMEYVCDTLNNQIRAIPPSGPTLIMAGAANGTAGFLGDNIPALASMLNAPVGLTRDGHTGVLFFCDSQNGRIRYFNPSGRIYTYAGGGLDASDTVNLATSALLNQPFGLALDTFGNLYFTERGTGRVREVDSSGHLSTLAFLTPNALGPIAISNAGDRLWVGDGGTLRLVLPAQSPMLQASGVLTVPGSVFTGLAYNQFDTLYTATTAQMPFGLNKTSLQAIPVALDGFLTPGQPAESIGGTGGQSAWDQDYSASSAVMPDAKSQLLAGAGYCSLSIDLTHQSDPNILSGLLYVGNSYADATGKQWAQLVRLTPVP